MTPIGNALFRGKPQPNLKCISVETVIGPVENQKYTLGTLKGHHGETKGAKKDTLLLIQAL